MVSEFDSSSGFGIPLASMKIQRKIFFMLFSAVAILAVMKSVPASAAALNVLKISPSSGVPGTTVIVNVAGLGPFTGKGLYVTFDDKQIARNDIVPATNIPPIPFIVPDTAAPGFHSVKLISDMGTIEAESMFYISSPQIVLGRWSATVGTTIKAVCQGFHAGKEVVLKYYATDEPLILASQIASDTGECTLQFEVPASGEGEHNIIAANQFGNSADTTLFVLPSLSISIPVAYAGDKVDIYGTGFMANSEVTANLGANKVAVARTTDRGSFDAGFLVPVITAGVYTVGIADAINNTMWIDLTIASAVNISKTTGEVGLKVQIDGSGFAFNSLVRINYDDKEITTVMSNETGGFLTNIDIPASVAGAHMITVTDGFNVKQATFMVEADPPPVPDVYIPKPDSIVTAETTFAWGSVYDPSEPVLYTLQIAATKDFKQPIFEMTGLSVSEYTLTSDETLRPSRKFTDYYWRVRATDSASNEGAWSDPVAFEVELHNTLPAWANIVLICIGGLLAITMTARIWAAAKAAGKTPEKKS